MLNIDVSAKAMQVLDVIRYGDGYAPAVLPTTACRRVGIAYSLFMRSINNNPELQELFIEALGGAHDQLAEMLVDPAFWPSRDPKEAQIWSKNVQWLLERLKPEKYGMRVKVENTTSADKVIVDALRAAIERIPLPPQSEGQEPLMIDVTPQEVTVADLL